MPPPLLCRPQMSVGATRARRSHVQTARRIVFWVSKMAEYLSPQQEQVVARLLASPMARTEWPTWLLIPTVYASWFATLYWSRTLGLTATTVLLILSCTWYMSLQHELVHGHPTRFRQLNRLLGFAPLAVWFPYTLYMENHLRHHNDAHLTLPGVDPETHYVLSLIHI